MSEIQRWWAPGRINLLGEHLDYNGGAALPVAIDRGILIKARRRDDSEIRVWSSGSESRRGEFKIGVEPGQSADWLSYLAGVVAGLRSRGLSSGADLVIESTLTEGAGLSSSAALTCGSAFALNNLYDLGLDSDELIAVARTAEHEFAGTPSGYLDQSAVVFAQADNALHLDFATEPPARQLVPFDLGSAEVALVLIDTRTRRRLADGRYQERHAECEQARVELGLDHLANVTLDGLLTLTDEALKARARHVLTETTRVRSALRTMHEQDLERFGALLTASHESLRDDFQVSCAELDIAVESALTAGALGAKLTGAGFAGCVIALIPISKLSAVERAVCQQFENAGWREPAVTALKTADGIHQLADSEVVAQ